MLLGSYVAILSPKRRVAIPKKFLNELGEEIILAKWYEGCLVIVSQTNWNALLKRLTGEGKIITLGIRDTDRFILGSAYEIKPDDQGRIVIPGSLAAYALLGKELVFLGLGDRVEIWDKDSWQKREQYIQKNAVDLLEKISAEGRETVNKKRFET